MQNLELFPLFTDPKPDQPRTLIDDPERGCWVTHTPGFLAWEEASSWMARLSAELPFQDEAPIIRGKPMPVLRKTCGIGDKRMRFEYSGVENVSVAWPAGFEAIVDRVRAHADCPFNYAFCNLYPDGKAGVGWHMDYEMDHVRQAPIASLSFGAPREFAMRLGRQGRASTLVTLRPGALLVMGGATQKHYQHRVPPRLRCAEPRINLTFRLLR